MANELFSEVFNIKKGDVVCIVGAGGKTSLMLHLAEELKQKEISTLLTTTTKLAANEVNEQYCFLTDIKGDKAIAPDMQLLMQKTQDYDVTLIEADGANRKSLKGWRKNEPVIPDFATMTIGVVDITTMGKKIEEPLVHRLESFKELTGADSHVKTATLVEIINHQNGLFRHSNATRNVIYCSKAESSIDFENAEKLTGNLKLNIMVTAGSVLTGQIKKFK